MAVGRGITNETGAHHHVVALDFSVKRNILRILVDLGCRVTVMPAQSSYEDVMAHNPDGVFLQWTWRSSLVTTPLIWRKR